MWARGVVLFFIVIGLFLTFSSARLRAKYSLLQSQRILEKSMIGKEPQKNIFYTVDHKTKRILRWNKVVE